MKKVFIIFTLVFIFILTASRAEARQGCCSYHGGVRYDGCGCNDGTPLSSTCAPYYSCSSAPQQTEPQQVIQRISTPTDTPFPTARPTFTPTPTVTKAPTPTHKQIKKQLKNKTKIIPAPVSGRHWWDWIFGR